MGRERLDLGEVDKRYAIIMALILQFWGRYWKNLQYKKLGIKRHQFFYLFWGSRENSQINSRSEDRDRLGLVEIQPYMWVSSSDDIFFLLYLWLSGKSRVPQEHLQSSRFVSILSGGWQATDHLLIKKSSVAGAMEIWEAWPEGFPCLEPTPVCLNGLVLRRIH